MARAAVTAQGLEDGSAERLGEDDECEPDRGVWGAAEVADDRRADEHVQRLGGKRAKRWEREPQNLAVVRRPPHHLEFYGQRLHVSGAGDFWLVRRLAFLAFLVASAAGCGGGKGSAPRQATNAAAPPTHAGLTVRAVRGEGFSIAVPKRWRSIDASTVLRGAYAKQFERDNPAAAGAVE